MYMFLTPLSEEKTLNVQKRFIVVWRCTVCNKIYAEQAVRFYINFNNLSFKIQSMPNANEVKCNFKKQLSR